MQKIATRIFIYASVAFGIFGVAAIVSSGTVQGNPNPFFMKLVMISVFILLPSFALSVAAKYLNGKS